ncbi:MAG: hypothetical protein P4L33_04475 [Capsulimonadaceae bacterium]|nr:hypothetical protein [Capsulimonadaceae bacterium]
MMPTVSHDEDAPVSSEPPEMPAAKDPAFIAWLIAGCIALWLRWVFATNAGALWRDEANSVALSTLPSIRDVWNHLEYDSFPILWMLAIRCVHNLSGDSDFAYRLFGLAATSLTVIVLALIARDTPIRWPVFSTVLLGLNPSVIHWGGSSRAYGWGMLAYTVMFWTFWRNARCPNARNCAWASAAAIISVQTLYYNSFLTAALVAGGCAAVLVMRGPLCKLVYIVVPAALAALSLLPYVVVFRRLHKWSDMVTSDVTLGWLLQKFHDAVGTPSTIVFSVWIGLATIVLIVGVLSLLLRRKHALQPDLSFTAFSLVNLVFAVPFYFGFLLALKYTTQPWYYLDLMTVLALSVDSLLMPALNRKKYRIIAPIFALLYAAVFVAPVLSTITVRQTNIDLIASMIGRAATPRDYVLLDVWHAVTFSRYYHGTAAWDTMPPIPFHKYHRYDLVKRLLGKKDTMEPVFEHCAAALKRGGRVIVVGPVSNDGVYWTGQTGAFLASHAQNVGYARVDCKLPVSSYECPTLQVFDGWRTNANTPRQRW